MILDEVGTYLATNTALTLGTDLFLGVLPPSPDACTALYELTSSPPDYTVGSTNDPILEAPRVQVYCRGATGQGGYSAARTSIETSWLQLQQVANTALSGTNYLRISAVNSPGFLRRDENDRPIFTAILECVKELS